MADEEMVTIVEFSEDIGDAEAPEPLPIGEYPATIMKAEVKTSGSGKRYAAVSFHVAPEEYPADYPLEMAPDGKTIVYRLVPMEDDKQSRFRLRRFCEAIGAPMSKKMDVSEWVGMDAKLTIEHDSWEGLPRENISRVNEA